MNRIPLSQVCNYSDASVPVSELDLNNFISTDNMLPNRGGIVAAANLPPANTCSAFTKNEILISNIRPYFKKIWFAEFDGGCSADVLVLKTTNPKFDAKFVYYNLFQDLFFKHQMTGSKGSKMPRGDKDQIMTFLIPEFDKSYQQRIADFLTVIDDKIALNKRINTELENLAKTIYNYWFVQFDFPNEEGKPYKTSGGEMEWNEELKREIPKGWVVDELEKIIEVKDGTHDSPKPSNEGFHLITSKHLTKSGIDFNSAYLISESDYKSVNKRSKVDNGDILISMIGTVGLLYFVQEIEINYAIKNIGLFKTSQDKRYAEYLYLSIQSVIGEQYFTSNKSGSIQKYLTLEALRSIPLIKPSETVLNSFKVKVSPILQLIHNYNIENQELIKLRDFLLPLLMNGQVKVKSEATEQLSMAAEPQVKYGK